MYLNQATIIGNLTRDVELRSLPDGSKVASFGVATNENYKDKQGNKVESVEFHNAVAWGKLGENIAQYMKKGSHIMIQGKLKTSSWDDKETGKKMYKTEIQVNTCQFGRKSASGTQVAPETTPTETSQTITTPEQLDNGMKTEPTKVNVPTIEYPAEEINPEDIPF